MPDVYPSLFTADYYPSFFPDLEAGQGGGSGPASARLLFKTMARAYDVFYDLYEDPQVINFLSGKAKQYNMANTKDTPELIRANCTDGILREIYKAAVDGDINGNFGMHQSAVVDAAVVLDTMPDTKEMIDWVFQNASGPWGGGGATNDGAPGRPDT